MAIPKQPLHALLKHHTKDRQKPLYSLEQVHQFLLGHGVHRWHSAEDLLRDVLLQVPRELKDLNLIPVSEVGTPDWAQRLYREEPLFRAA